MDSSIKKIGNKKCKRFTNISGFTDDLTAITNWGNLERTSTLLSFSSKKEFYPPEL